MAITSSIIAVVGLAVGVGSTIAARNQAKKSQAAQEQASKWQEASQSEESAANARQAAVARRQAIREERVKRAQIMQASETSGTGGSSGEAGAIGGMQTQLGSNMGQSQGMIMQGQRVSFNSQASANWMTKAGTYQNRSNAYNQLGGAGFGLMNMGINSRMAKKQPTSNFSMF